MKIQIQKEVRIQSTKHKKREKERVGGGGEVSERGYNLNKHIKITNTFT